ncbi:MAG: hypothetical protein COA78_26160 [Blastopirellula sp.]|nr:MAG: hypothetical protein COA78_26160 [Blastopirellula sp.]
MVLTSLVLVGITESLTSRQASYRNTNAYEKALYLAGAGIHHGITELNSDPTWRGTLSNVELPAGSGDTYSVSAADGTGDTIVLSAEGSSESVVRRLEVTINTNG